MANQKFGQILSSLEGNGGSYLKVKEDESGFEFQHTEPIGDWITGYVYYEGDLVIVSLQVYRCNTGHTASAAFATDVAKWDRVSATIGDDTNKTSFAINGLQTMSGTARPWRDEICDAISLKQTGSGVAINNTELTVEFLTTSNLSDYMYTNVQLNHDRDLTSIVSPHIHWLQTSSSVPNFLLQYRWQTLGGTKVTSWTNLKCNTTILTYPGSGTIHQLAEAADILAPAGTNISDIIQFRIIRDNANTSGAFTGGADPIAATVSVLAFDVHIQINSIGSAGEYSKA